MDDTYDLGNDTAPAASSGFSFGNLASTLGNLVTTGANAYAAVKGAPTAKQKNVPVVTAAEQNTSVTKYMVIGISAVVGAVLLLVILLRGRKSA